MEDSNKLVAMNKYEEALECPNCILGLNCKTCKKKMVLQESVKKAQALDRALDLLKQKRENAQNDLDNLELKDNAGVFITLKNQIATYTDCIATIEAEMGRTER